MEYVVEFLVGTAITWVILLIVLPLAQKLADFGLPAWPQLLWQAALLSAIVNALSVALDPVSGWVSWLASLVVFWALMVKWFDVDFFGAIIIIVIGYLVRWWALMLLLGLLA